MVFIVLLPSPRVRSLGNGSYGQPVPQRAIIQACGRGHGVTTRNDKGATKQDELWGYRY